MSAFRQTSVPQLTPHFNLPSVATHIEKESSLGAILRQAAFN